MKKCNKIENKYYVEVDKKLLEDTGEIKIVGSPINVAEQEQSTPRGGFEIAYMSALFDIFDQLGNQKMKVLKYLLKNKDGMNCLNISQRQLANETGVGLTTVNSTMKLLKEAGVITQKGSVIRLSARVFVKGDAKKEAYIMRKFVEEQEEGKIIPMPTGTED